MGSRDQKVAPQRSTSECTFSSQPDGMPPTLDRSSQQPDRRPRDGRPTTGRAGLRLGRSPTVRQRGHGFADGHGRRRLLIGPEAAAGAVASSVTAFSCKTSLKSHITSHRMACCISSPNCRALLLAGRNDPATKNTHVPRRRAHSMILSDLHPARVRFHKMCKISSYMGMSARPIPVAHSTLAQSPRRRVSPVPRSHF